MGVSASRVAGGAASGAALGSTFGPWGTALGGIGGGILGMFGGDPEGDARAAEEEAGRVKLEAMRKAAGELEAYRPINQQARMNSMNSQLDMYGGAANALRQFYGPGAAPSPNRQNPFTQGAQGQYAGMRPNHPANYHLNAMPGGMPSASRFAGQAPHAAGLPQARPGGGAMPAMRPPMPARPAGGPRLNTLEELLGR